jgi:chromosome partitioning protein
VEYSSAVPYRQGTFQASFSGKENGMRTIAIANHKGGCGKTVTAINLAACLAEKEKRILLVDMDPQAHATLGLNVKPEDLDRQMYHVLSEAYPDQGMSDVILGVDQYLNLAPSDITLSAVEQELAGQPGREDRLIEAFSKLPEVYDFLVIDCPPSLGLLTINALRACREVIVPVETSFFAIHGLGKIMETIKLVEERFGHRKRINVLATIYDRRTHIAAEVLEEIRKHFGRDLLESVIGINVRLREATGYGQPICRYDRASRGYRDYSRLAEEVIRLAETGDWAERGVFVPATSLGAQPVENGVRFSVYAPKARNVQVAGDFNDWNPGDGALLDPDGEGVWSRVIRLEPGRYQYRYRIDGQWGTDPHNPESIETPFGVVNSVVELIASKDQAHPEDSSTELHRS